MIFLGDIHGDWNYLKAIVAIYGNEPIICLGEFGYWPRHEIWPPGIDLDNPIYFLDGNHEDFDSLEQNGWMDKSEPQEVEHNIFYIPRGTLLSIQGKNLLCCGGGESMDKIYRTIGIDWFPQEVISYSDIVKCKEGVSVGGIDYVLTHVAPACFDIEVAINLFAMPKFGSEKFLNYLVDDIMELAEVPSWFFAHYHQGACGKYREQLTWRALGLGEVFIVED